VNKYQVFKGRLQYGIPYLDSYGGNPHYVILLESETGSSFKIVTNVKSDSSLTGADGYHLLYSWDKYFAHPLCADLANLTMGLHETGFPKLDYCHDRDLVDFSRMRPVPVDAEGESNDCNDVLNEMLTIDLSKPPFNYHYQGKGHAEDREAYPPSADVTVYGFGFVFPAKDGLHETHMNQGNPVVRHARRGGRIKDHSSENGIHQDGAVIIEIGGKFQAFFAAFQTQLIPTDSKGFPANNAHPILSRSR
jgi:uncharacterized protein YukJ